MGRHLVLGQLEDYVTGESVVDTHDERLRQRIAHLLIDELDYRPDDLRARQTLKVQTERHAVEHTIDFVIAFEARAAMVIRYAPGALVARERPTLAVARLLEDSVVPWAAITNGLDARVLDAATGRLQSTGLDGFPRREALLASVTNVTPAKLSERQRAAEARILAAFDVLRCECAGGG